MDQDKMKEKEGYSEAGLHGIDRQPPPYSTSKHDSTEVLISTPEVHTPMTEPKDYLGCSIFTLLCCCLPLGLAAIIFSVKSRSAKEYNDYYQAKRHGKTAKRFIIASIITGIIIIIVYIVVVRELVQYEMKVIAEWNRQAQFNRLAQFNRQAQFNHQAVNNAGGYTATYDNL